VWKQVALVLLGVAALVFTLPVREANGTPFASPAFEQLWIQHQRAQLDLWGQAPLAWRIEPYADSPGGRRLVQYFDRGRMELTTLASVNRTSVTQGRLAWELTTGNIAIGSDLFVHRPPPDLPIDGGAADPRVPTYATLAQLVAQPASDRTANSQTVDTWITADGSREQTAPPVPIRLSRYIATTRHNLPDVTVSLFDRSPLGPEAWIDVFGYPISEPFWAYYRRGETALPSLIQVFERRILVYTPSLPADQRFTLVNTGRFMCTTEVGPRALEVRITSGDDRIWSSADCISGEGAHKRRLKRGIPYIRSIVWDRHRSAHDCRAERIGARPGTYVAVARGKAVKSGKVVFHLR